MKYWAFISYSHRDRAWGTWLHRRLETYRVPRALVGRETRGEPIPRRIFPIFRDREELPTSANLGNSIEEALRESRTLLVICSTAAAKSRWVEEEIRYYKSLGYSGRILCLVIDGEPNASDQPGGEERECFPKSIRFAVGPDGQLSGERVEPIAGDARPQGDGREIAFLKLVAGLLGVAFDELRQRERRRRRARLLTTTLTLVCLLAVMLGLWQLGEWRRQRALIRSASTQDVLHAERNVEAGRADKALALLAHAVERDPGNTVAWARLQSLLTQRAWPILLESGPLPKEAEPPAGFRSWTSREDLTIYRSEDEKEFRGLIGESGGSFTPVMKHPFAIDTVEVSGDARHLATIGKDEKKTLTVWEVRSGQTLGPAIELGKMEGPIVRLSPDGGRVLVITEDEARLFESATGRVFGAPLPVKGAVEAVFSADGKRVVTEAEVERKKSEFFGPPNRRWVVQVWEVSSTAPLGDAIEVEGRVAHLVFSQDGSMLALALEEGKETGSLGFWDATTGAPLGLRRPFAKQISGIGWRHDDGALFILLGDGSLQLVEPKTARSLGEPVRGIWWAAFRPGTARLRVTTAGEVSGVFRREEWIYPSGLATVSYPQRAEVEAMALSPGGEFLVTATQPEDGGDEGALQFWQTATGTRLAPAEMIDGRVRAVTFAPAGDLVAVAIEAPGGKRRTVQLYDLQTRKALPHTFRGGSPDWSADGSRVLTSEKEDGVSIWEARSGALVAGPFLPEGGFEHARLHPDGQRVLTVNRDKTANLWKVAEETPALAAVRVDALVREEPLFSPDGSLVALQTRTGLAFWDLATGRLEPLGLPSAQGPMVFARDGSVLAVGVGLHGRVALCDARQRAVLYEPIETGSELTSLDFSDDGKRLLTGTEGGLAQVWDVTNGQSLGGSLEHAGPVRAALFEGRGRYVITAAGKEVRRWDIGGATADSAAMDVALGLEAARLGGGFEVNARGGLAAVPDRFARVQALRKRMAEEGDLSPWAATVRALFEDAGSPAARGARREELVAEIEELGGASASPEVSGRLLDRAEALLSHLQIPALGERDFAYDLPSYPARRDDSDESTPEEGAYEATAKSRVTRAWQITEEDAAAAKRAATVLRKLELGEGKPAGPLVDARIRLDVAWKLAQLLQPRTGRLRPAKVSRPAIEKVDGRDVWISTHTNEFMAGEMRVDRTGITLEFPHRIEVKFTPGYQNNRGEKELFGRYRRKLHWSPHTLAYGLRLAAMPAASRPGDLERGIADMGKSIAEALQIGQTETLRAILPDGNESVTLDGTLASTAVTSQLSANPTLIAINQTLSGCLMVDIETGKCLGFGGGVMTETYSARIEDR